MQLNILPFSKLPTISANLLNQTKFRALLFYLIFAMALLAILLTLRNLFVFLAAQREAHHLIYCLSIINLRLVK
jgi:hypothetical protein